jgi:hypothetical protein
MAGEGGNRDLKALASNEIDSDILLVTSLAERVAQPLQTLVETITRGGAGRLDVLRRGQRRVQEHRARWGRKRLTQAR